MLDIIALILGLTHFSIPLIYYYYLKRHINDLWNLKIDRNYVPPITVIVPTYNESVLIEKKLDNIYEQDYPKDEDSDYRYSSLIGSKTYLRMARIKWLQLLY